MATIKSYSDLQQSKKLAEILPLESADMYYDRYGDPYIINLSVTHERIKNDKYQHLIPCWSLTALFKLLPKSAQLEKGNATELYRVTLPVELESSDWYIESVDACYEMIIKLHELNLL